MKILIIDDEADIRLIAKVSLSRIGGMEVIDADNGAEGVRRAAEEMPDAILLDVMMPLMDGPATFSALRGNAATAAIPVIFLTAKAMRSEIERLQALGAAGVLTKPFDPLTLPEQLRRILQITPH
ncbi:MAG: response regulator [Blastocatellia bacterium]